MASNFKRAEVLAGTTRTAIYGPVASGVTAIVFSGTFANIDSTNKSSHNFTLEVRNASNAYIPRMQDIPVPYGATSECPKTVLVAGEYLYITSPDSNAIQAAIDILERS